MLMTINYPVRCFKSLFVLLQCNIAETSTLILTKMCFQTKTRNMVAKCYVCKGKNPRICFPSDGFCLLNSGTCLWRWMSGTSTQHIHPSSRSWCRHLLPFLQNHWNLQLDWVCVLLWASEHEISVWLSQLLCVSELGGGGGCSWSGTDRHNKPGTVGYTASVSASCVTNQSLNPQVDPANQMPGSLSGGDSDISIRASTVMRVLHLGAALELQCS